MAVLTPAFLAQGVFASDGEVIERSRREPECFAVIFDRYHFQIHGYAASPNAQAPPARAPAESFSSS